MTLEPIEPPAPTEGSTPTYDAELRAGGQLTSPTWELELFLSGAVVFAMLQLPGVIEGIVRQIEPHATATGRLVIFVGSLYAKAIAFTLIATFLIHLVARAQWVALLGLHSVFPRGIRWDEMKVGPVAREVYEARMPNLGGVIARLDNICSIVFSTGLLVVIVFAYSTLLAAALAAVAFGFAKVFSGGAHMRQYLYVVGAVFVAIPLIATLVDKRIGARIDRNSMGYRVLRGAIALAFSLNLMRITGPMMWTLATNIGRMRSIAFLYVALMFIIFVATADRLYQSDRLSINSYDFFGDSRQHSVDATYYEDQRRAGDAYMHAPSIQSDIIKDPYVKLFIPYNPRRHNAAIAKSCPGIRPLQERGLQVGAEPYLADSLVVPVLACLSRLHAVTLDGVAQSDMPLAFHTHARSGLNGVIAYLPVATLASGRHVVTVMPVPPEELPTDSAALARAAWKQPYVIPFWR